MAGEPLTSVDGLRERMERQLAEAAFVLAGVRELQRFRGRVSKITVGDMAGVLGASQNLTTAALIEAVVALETSDGR